MCKKSDIMMMLNVHQQTSLDSELSQGVDY
jgi:hypothetical protein